MTSKFVPSPNQGSQQLQGKGTKREIAAATAVSPGTSGDWLTGRRLPGPEARQRVLARYGIDPSAWDTPATRRGGSRKSPDASRRPVAASPPSIAAEPGTEAPAAPPPPASPGEAEESNPGDNASELHATIRSDLARLRGTEGEGLELGKRSEVIKRLVDAQASLKKSTGSGQLTVEHILGSSAWDDLLGTIVEALVHWPCAVWALKSTTADLAKGPESDEARMKRLRGIRACYGGDLMREADTAAKLHAGAVRAGADADELKILEHPKFLAAVKVIVDATAPFPDAHRAILDALQTVNA